VVDLGRWRNTPHIDHKETKFKAQTERAAVNFGVQGSAADIVMCAMLQIHRSERLAALGFRLVMQVHDEFVIEGPEEHALEAREIIREAMENPFRDLNPEFKLSVPLLVESGVGPSWYAAKDGSHLVLDTVAKRKDDDIKLKDFSVEQAHDNGVNTAKGDLTRQELHAKIDDFASTLIKAKIAEARLNLKSAGAAS
jgi:hypothetical protein